MKKIKFIAAAFLMIVLAIAATYSIKAYGSSAKVETAIHTNNITDTYICPMHPEVSQNEPGTCPKCGMDLVLNEVKKDNENANMKECSKDSAKCKEMGCDMSKCKENEGNCKEKCMMMNDMKDKDMKGHDMNNHDMKMMDGCKNMKSDGSKKGSCCDK
jgi:hypothetical protein